MFSASSIATSTEVSGLAFAAPINNMSWLTIAWLALGANWTTVVNARAVWNDGQVNATMCAWQSPRVATIRDTVYIDGGYLIWSPGMQNGEYGEQVEDHNELVYTLNFSQAFNTTANFSDIMRTDLIPKPKGLSPNYVDGAMLANDHEFFLYGGLLKGSSSDPPHGDEVLGYKLESYGPDKPLFEPGYTGIRLPQNMTRYITFGGAASSPSENKAWYFGGAGSPSGGPIYFPEDPKTDPTNVSDTLITLDMATQGLETMSNETLGPNIKGRASPELVWVPVGEQGILVVLGGVLFPGYDNYLMKSTNEEQSRAESPSFMSTIDIYDVASKQWYQQKSVAGPGQLAQGCAVVAVAQDRSSYNIYYYGGYDGLDVSKDFNDDVWILSLPSFMWMKVATGTKGHARAGHKCVTPYPDQMMVIGGLSAGTFDGPRCVQGNEIVQIFNLTNGKWLDSYDPTNYGDYGVPEMVHQAIGGDYAGGATITTPAPSGWDNKSLASVFQTLYPTSRITTHYPYAPAASNGTRPTVHDEDGGGLASWVAPVLGVVLGLVFITALVVGVLLYRRRKLLRRNGNPSMSEGGTDENGHRILSWIRGQDTAKAPTVTTEDTPNLDDTESRAGGPQMAYLHSQAPRSPLHARPQQPPAAAVPHEMPDTPLFEMMDTSPRVELSDTGLTPVDVINKHSHFGRSPQSAATPTNPSSLSHSQYAVSQDHTSISSGSAHRLVSGPASEGRPDSPPFGSASGAGMAAEAAPTTATGAQHPARLVSGVSNLSEREASHLRQISDTSVSSVAATFSGDGAPRSGAASPTLLSPMQAPPYDSGKLSPPLPVSPPTSDEREAADYLSVQGRSLTPQANVPNTVATANPASPLRRSVFYESADDLGESYRQQQQNQQPPHQ